MKFGKTTLFFIILAVALLATLGMNIKEGLKQRKKEHRGKEHHKHHRGNKHRREKGRHKHDQNCSHAKQKENMMEHRRRTYSDKNSYDKFLSERGGVRRVDIPENDNHLYVLKSSIVPPVCPKCPQQSACPRQKPCPACPACSRCPEPAFTCKKVPNYSSTNNQYLPLPWLG
jgi:hypothetical protein